MYSIVVRLPVQICDTSCAFLTTMLGKTKLAQAEMARCVQIEMDQQMLAVPPTELSQVNMALLAHFVASYIEWMALSWEPSTIRPVATSDLSKVVSEPHEINWRLVVR